MFLLCFCRLKRYLQSVSKHTLIYSNYWACKRYNGCIFHNDNRVQISTCNKEHGCCYPTLCGSFQTNKKWRILIFYRHRQHPSTTTYNKIFGQNLREMASQGKNFGNHTSSSAGNNITSINQGRYVRVEHALPQFRATSTCVDRMNSALVTGREPKTAQPIPQHQSSWIIFLMACNIRRGNRAVE